MAEIIAIRNMQIPAVAAILVSFVSFILEVAQFELLYLLVQFLQVKGHAVLIGVILSKKPGAVYAHYPILIRR